jgi:hypothetical protein
MVEIKARLQARNGIRIQRGTKLETGAGRRRPAVSPNTELLSETRAKLHLLSVEKGRSSTNNQQASLINVPFFIAGTLKNICDLFLYWAFVAVRRPEEAR